MGGLVILTEDEKDLFYAINLSYCMVKCVRKGAFFVFRNKAVFFILRRRNK